MIGDKVPVNRETPDLYGWIVFYVENVGRPPTADEIRGAANFSQPGGISRLIDALEKFGAHRAHFRKAVGQ